MDYEEAVSEFLSRKENFRLALEVAERMDDVKARKQIAFWEQAYTLLQTKLQNSPRSDSWIVDSAAEEDLLREDCGIYFIQKRFQDMPGSLYFGLTHYEHGRYYVYHRLAWEEEPRTQDQITEEVGRLRDALKADGWRSSKWSVGWKHIRAFDSHKSFLLELVERSEELAESCAEAFWEFFCSRAEDAAKANLSLAGET